MKKIAYISNLFRPNEAVRSAVSRASANVGAEFLSIESIVAGDSIIEFVWSLLREADVIVVDFEDITLNVSYELGLAHGLDKPVVLLSSRHDIRLPADLLTQRIITYNKESAGFVHLEFTLAKLFDEIFVDGKNLKGLRGPREWERRSEISESPSILKFQDVLHAKRGQKGFALERWFQELSGKIDGWEVMSPDKGVDIGYDFIIWNTLVDSKLASLGNPIPVQLKAVTNLHLNYIDTLSYQVQQHKLKSLIFCTTAELQSRHRELAREIYRYRSFILILLDKNDLLHVETPKSLVDSIRAKLIDIIYEVGADV